MNTANERARSLVLAGGLLVQLAEDESLPLAVRQYAVAIARHFPTIQDVTRMASYPTPMGFGLELASKGDIERWVRGCPNGPLCESTRLTLPE
jgi:hypothetical protein